MSEFFGDNTGWMIGYIVGVVVVLVVVALVVPILVLARRIGNEAKLIDDSLKQSVVNTAALADLATTNTMAINVIQGLERGRKRLGG
jgi:ABC-type Fe3+ transport system permease subunit